MVKLLEADTGRLNRSVHNIIETGQEKNEIRDGILYDLTNSSYTSDLFPKRMWKRYTLEALELLEQEERISVYQNKQGEGFCAEISYHIWNEFGELTVLKIKSSSPVECSRLWNMHVNCYQQRIR